MKDFLIAVVTLIVIIELWWLLAPRRTPLKNYSDFKESETIREQHATFPDWK